MVKPRIKSAFPGFMGDAVGIIGAGMIGRLVINMLRDTGVRVLVYDKFLSRRWKSLLLAGKKPNFPIYFHRAASSQTTSANNPATVGMINYSLFSLMRDGATFINTDAARRLLKLTLSALSPSAPVVCAS